ncbi:BTAD domain-containing putative transcriptional regulator [Actinoplanes solisilvae]|uniref:BTAD domain-containing putative transcriptional regulator n=1 Tax=Actinoplanes solisilvae TaxID=2486853 RepID=UPI000FDBF9AF|nr:AAA family ATPase [Actinoplanes solisilvae]
MSTPSQGLRVQILGPLRLWRDGVELDAGPPQQAYLLALLLARAGRVISTSELIDLIWGDDVPPSAINILQKYAGALRRLLEPELPSRATGSYLQRRGPGYVFAADPQVVDLAAFRELVASARRQDPDAALDSYLRALDLWHGPAGGGMARGTSATTAFEALDGEFLETCVVAAALAVTLGRPGRVLPVLQRAAEMAPLDENVQASLVVTLGAAGQQAKALSVFRTIQVRLAEELGIDPGPTLAAAQRRVLGGPSRPEEPVRPPPRERCEVVGRAEELAELEQAVDAAFSGGSSLTVVEGEPGVGKTRLLEETGAEADRRGALVVWGRCLEEGGTPSMWPWIQIIGGLVDSLPAAERSDWLAGELGNLVGLHGVVAGTPVLPDSGAQFRLFEHAVNLVRQVSEVRPVLLIIDDVQWADVASLNLLSHLAARLPIGTAVIGALRDRAPAPRAEVARTLAAVSRHPRHRRIRLGPLGPDEVAELVRRETGQMPSAAVARSIHGRTGGNAFFVRELSRFLVRDGDLTEDAAASAEVPSTVRDVVGDRLAGLDDQTRGLLQMAALIGRDVDLALLANAAGLEVQACLDQLEPLESLGLFEPRRDDPFSFRFAHDLVRESVTFTTSTPRVPGLHLRVAEALERTVEDDDPVIERLAHHLWAAGPLADQARTAAALVRAGRCAGAKTALDAAAHHLRLAARVARAAGLAELELSALSLFVAVDGMRAGYVGSALDLLKRAEHLARVLGREREAADLLFSRWAAHSQGIQLDRAGVLAHRLLEQGEASADPIVRAYGRHAWGIHQWDIGNITEAYKFLSLSDPALPSDPARRDRTPLRHDLQMLSPVMLGLMTALHGDVDAARELLDSVEAAAEDDPYATTVWSSFSVTVAALAGDPAWAMRAAARGIEQDEEFSFAFLGSYQRLGRCWARAVTGGDPDAAIEAEQIITAALLDPPRSGLATWYGLLAEMWLAAGRTDEAGAALDRADSFIAAYGQRYAEGFLLVLRARLMRARGDAEADVRAMAEQAWALSVERGAHLFARRARDLLD